MKILDKRMSINTRQKVVQLIIKEEILPLIENVRVMEYAKSNLVELARRAINTAVLTKEEITIDWLYDAVHYFVSYKRPDIMGDIDPNHGQDLDDGNMGAYEKSTPPRPKPLGKQTSTMKKTPPTTVEIDKERIIKDPITKLEGKVEQVVSYVISQVTLGTDRIVDKPIAAFISMGDAKEFVNAKNRSLELQSIGKDRRFYKMDIKITNRIAD